MVRQGYFKAREEDEFECRKLPLKNDGSRQELSMQGICKKLFREY